MKKFQLKVRSPCKDRKKLMIMLNPYVITFYIVNKGAWLYRFCVGDSVVTRLGVMLMHFDMAFTHKLPSFYPTDLLAGLTGAVILYGIVCYRKSNSKKFRQGV